MTLENFLATQIELSPELETAIQNEFKIVKLGKGETIFKAGKVAKHIYFIENGLARMYYHNEAGKDISFSFFIENNFMAPSESFFEQTPSQYYIDLIEDSTLRCISKDGLKRLSSNFPIVEKIQSHILMYFLFQANNRLLALQFQNAQQRYETLEEMKGNILSRAPLGHIASYLGITQETLSRIRAKR